MNKLMSHTLEKLSEKKILSRVKWKELSLCLVGFMIGRIHIQGLWNPLCVAYVGASYQTKNLQRWNGLFTILGILSVTQSFSLSIKSIASILLVLLIRWYMESMKIELGLFGQAVIATIATLVISIVIIAVQGFSFYYFIQSLLELVFIFTFVYIYQKSIDIILESKKTPLTNQQVISITVLLVSIIGGMVELYIEFAGSNRIYARDIICFFLIITIAYLGEMAVGAAMGTVIGTLLVMIGYIPPHLISIYALAGLGGGLLAPSGKVGTVIGALAGYMVGIYFINEGIIDYSLLGAYGMGAVLFFLCPSDFFGFSYWFGDEEKQYEQEIHMRRIQKLTTVKLEDFSRAFKKLATTFSDISNKKTALTQKDISHLFEDVTDQVCSQCSLFEYCWEKDFYNTYQAAYGILAAAEHKDQIIPSDVPIGFKNKCIKLESFVQSLNQRFELYKQDLIWHNRIAESRELISQQLNSVSTIIQKLSNEIEDQIEFKRKLEGEVKEELAAKGIKIKDALIILNGNKKYEITVITARPVERDEDEMAIIAIANTVVGKKFKIENHYSRDQEEFTIVLKEAYTYGVVAATASVAKESHVSGDQYSTIEIPNGQYLLALSDGMGSGISAHDESVATIELLEEFIKSGFDKTMAIRMINSVLILKSNEESFSTMDMAVVDMYSGITEFIKIGAATTFIKKENYVESVGSTSLPVGILNKVDIETHQKQLKDGDMIIMVTDGILDAEKDQFNQENTFIQFIEEIESKNPSYMANCLLEKAQNLMKGEVRDDMTIVVARVWKKLYKN